MADRALANAEKRRDDIAAEINKQNQVLEELRKELSAVESFIADWHRFAADNLDSGWVTGPDALKDTSYPQGRIAAKSHDGESPWATTAPALPTPKNPDKAEVGKVAKTIIYESRRPVPRTVLFKALADRGVTIYGKDPEMVLSTMLWRLKDDFVRLPGHGYWIKSLRWPPAKYEPGDSPPADIEDVAIQLNALQDEDAPPTDSDPDLLGKPPGKFVRRF